MPPVHFVCLCSLFMYLTLALQLPFTQRERRVSQFLLVQQILTLELTQMPHRFNWTLRLSLRSVSNLSPCAKKSRQHGKGLPLISRPEAWRQSHYPALSHKSHQALPRDYRNWKAASTDNVPIRKGAATNVAMLQSDSCLIVQPSCSHSAGSTAKRRPRIFSSTPIPHHPPACLLRRRLSSRQCV